MSSPHDCSHFLKPNFQKQNIVALVFLSVTLCFEASHFVFISCQTDPSDGASPRTETSSRDRGEILVVFSPQQA